MAIRKQRRVFWLTLFFVAIILMGFFLYRFFGSSSFTIAKSIINNNSTSTPELSATTTLSFLSGEVIPLEQASSSFAAIMVDNYTAENSQFGIADAPLVFEAPVEGGITRFMAVVPIESNLAQIGPVRSARPYFIDYASEFKGLYVHVGGSAAALDKVKNSKDVTNIDEMVKSNYFWRDSNKVAPHSTFTSTDLLKKVVIEKTNLLPLKGWLFVKDNTQTQLGNTTGTIIGIGNLKVEWKYSKKDNSYTRIVDSSKQKDAANKPIVAKNIAVVYTDIKSIDADDRREIRTLGSGRALILHDGREIPGSWTKDSAASRLRFFGPDSREIQFNPGITWVEVTTK